MSDPRLPPKEDAGLDDDLEIDESGDAADEGEDTALDEADQADDGSEEEGQEEQARDVASQPRSRSRNNVQILRERAQAAERGLEDLRREFTDFRSRQPQPGQISPHEQARLDAEEQARVEQMMPHDAARYYAEKNARHFQQQLAITQFQAFDRQDQSDFARLKDTNREAARLAPDVERILAAQRAQGIYSFTRAQVFAYRYGEEMLAKARQERPRQQRHAAGRVAAQRTRPGNARGDVARGGRDRVDADEALLRGITVGDI